MFLISGNLPPESTRVRIVMPVRCAATSAAMCVDAKTGAVAKANQPKNRDIWAHARYEILDSRCSFSILDTGCWMLDNPRQTPWQISYRASSIEYHVSDLILDKETYCQLESSS